MAVDANHTEATLVAARLREEIVRGLVPPASKLKLAPLAEKYGISRGPLREAASRLAAERLVVFEDHRGFRVAPISREDLIDVTRTRMQIETLALADAIENGDDEWEGRVVAALHRIGLVAKLPAGEERRAAFSVRHAELHAELCSSCTSAYLLGFRSTLYSLSERYRCLADERYASQAVGRDIQGEHEALVEAAVARDIEGACTQLEEHLRATAETLIEGYPELFG